MINRWGFQGHIIPAYVCGSTIKARARLLWTDFLPLFVVSAPTHYSYSFHHTAAGNCLLKVLLKIPIDFLIWCRKNMSSLLYYSHYSSVHEIHSAVDTFLPQWCSLTHFSPGWIASLKNSLKAHDFLWLQAHYLRGFQNRSLQLRLSGYLLN